MDLEMMRQGRDLTEFQTQIVDQLSQVIDPELGLDLINLGLIYEVIEEAPGKLKVLMTLTTPMCPLAGVLIGDIQAALGEIPGVEDIQVELTFDPPWSLENLSRYAKIALGML